MKTLVVGDTHGCHDQLIALLAKAQLDLARDRLILLGDYIDRGPKSFETIKYLQNLQETYGQENVILLRGNHEQMAIDYLEKGSYSWFHNGAEATINNFAENQADLKEAVSFFKSLRWHYTDDQFVYVHAGLKPGVKLGEQKEKDLLWIREEFYESSFDFGKKVIFGHTPTRYISGKDYPVMMDRKIALDTSCVFGGYLSALEIRDGNIDRVISIG